MEATIFRITLGRNKSVQIQTECICGYALESTWTSWQQGLWATVGNVTAVIMPAADNFSNLGLRNEIKINNSKP